MEEKLIEEEVAKRVEELVAKRVEEELAKRSQEIEEEVLRRVEEAKRIMEKEMLEELERQRAVELESQRIKEVRIHPVYCGVGVALGSGQSGRYENQNITLPLIPAETFHFAVLFWFALVKFWTHVCGRYVVMLQVKYNASQQ
jgi:hypothetical protein